MKKIIKSKKILIIMFTLMIFLMGFGSTKISAAMEFANDDFDIHTVNVIMTKEASREFRNYQPRDFVEIGVVAVKDLTSHTVDYVRDEVVSRRRRGVSRSEEDLTMLVNIEGFQRILTLILANPSRESVFAAIDILRQREDVYDAEPNRFITFSSTPQYTNQWNPAMVHQLGFEGLESFQTNVSEVIVGVIDTGIDSSHPDLTNRMHSGTETLHRSFVEMQDVPVINPEDVWRAGEIGHGTQVAGIIVAMNPKVRLVCLRVYEGTNQVIGAVVRAINFAASRGIPILNFSADGYGRCPAIRAAVEHYTGLFVTAAGNSGESIDNQEHMSSGSVLRVGALDNNGRRSIWNTNRTSSNHGNHVHIWAPGGATMNQNSTNIRTTAPSAAGNFRFFWGTSAAAPFVAGTASLMLAQSRLSAEDLRRTILNNTETTTITIPIWNNNGTAVLRYENRTVRRLNPLSAVSSVFFPTNDLDANSISINRSNNSTVGTVIIPSRINGRTVTTIGQSAFNGSNIRELRIPTSIRTIGSFAFANTSNLRTIHNMTTSPQPINNETFSGINRLNVRLYIPQGSRQNFINAGWGNFNIIEVRAIQGNLNLETNTPTTYTLDSRILGTNISWAVQGNVSINPQPNLRAISITANNATTITLVVTVDGVSFTQTINVTARPVCGCNPNPNIIQRCCCADRWEPCPILNPWRPWNEESCCQ